MKHHIVLALIFLSLPLQIFAEGIGFNRSRLVYQEGSAGEIITAKNGSTKLYLLHSGVTITPSGKEVGPFWVTPPIARLEGNSQNIIRITGNMVQLAKLPKDRESVFWFFSTAIPSQPESISAGEARLSIGLRTLLKIFYRPKGLPGNADDTVLQLRATSQKRGVVISNPTPYYASFSSLSLDNKVIDLNEVPSMIPPYGDLLFNSVTVVRRVTFSLMTDYGGASSKKTILLNTAP